MLNGDGRENSKKNKSIGLFSSTRFFVHFFDVVWHGYDVKLPSYTSYEGK